MATSVRAAFRPNIAVLKIASIQFGREVGARERKEQKYRQIEASILCVGIIEPLVVFPGEKGTFRLLDGNKRLDILARRNIQEVECLLATEDEAFTYNKRVNYLSPVGEHQMILRALKHNSEAAIAQALAVNIRTIRRKRDLLAGICNEAIELLKDRRVSPRSFSFIRKMKPIRQVEVARLMINSNRYSEPFAEALLAGTRGDMLVTSKTVKGAKALSLDQKDGLERETDELLQNVKAVEESYGKNVLALSVSCRYVSRVLANSKLRHYVEGRFPDILSELEAVISAVDSGSNFAAVSEAVSG